MISQEYSFSFKASICGWENFSGTRCVIVSRFETLGEKQFLTFLHTNMKLRHKTRRHNELRETGNSYYAVLSVIHSSEV